MFRQDFIKRYIEQLAAFLAKLAQFKSEGRLAEADDELATMEAQLGMFRGGDRLDPKSLAFLLGGGDRVVLACLLIEQRAELADARGDLAHGLFFRKRARELLAFARPRELEEHAKALAARL